MCFAKTHDSCAQSSSERLGTTHQQQALYLTYLLGHINKHINLLINNILHHPSFQQLEATWLGLYKLKRNIDKKDTECFLLNITWKEIKSDLNYAIDFDQSCLFNKIYNEQFGIAGGKPFGLLIGDYNLQLQGKAALQDIQSLTSISQIAAASFAPFITGISPESFGLTNISQLNGMYAIAQIFSESNYTAWNTFRKTEESRFVGLTINRTLLRKPYKNTIINASHCYNETFTKTDNSEYSWGHSCYVLAEKIMMNFKETKWFTTLQNSSDFLAENNGPDRSTRFAQQFNPNGFNHFHSVETFFSELVEYELSQLGFMPLCQLRFLGQSVFYSQKSAHLAKNYEDIDATNNSKISANLHYILCASRFAHYLKIIARDKIGSFKSTNEFESYLNRWLAKYIALNELDNDIRYTYPLRGGAATIREKKGLPGHYYCIMHLKPRLDLENVSASITLTTQLLK